MNDRHLTSSERENRDDEPANTWREFVWGVIVLLGILFFLIGW